MSLPLPSLGNPMANLGTSLAIGQKGIRSAAQLAQRTTTAFGDLLSQLNPQPTNPAAVGPLVVNSTETNPHPSTAKLPKDSSEPSFASRLERFKNKLRDWLDQTRQQLGISDSQPSLELRFDSEDNLQVTGPEPLRSHLWKHLNGSEEHKNELRELQKSQPSPLQWLPHPHGLDSENSSRPIEPIRIIL